LENKDNSMSYQLEKIESIFWEANFEKTDFLLSQMNTIFQNDDGVMKKWDFISTLENLKLNIV
jgi:hypothetical protein